MIVSINLLFRLTLPGHGPALVVQSHPMALSTLEGYITPPGIQFKIIRVSR
jgi:hypothetical protein